MDKKGRLLCSAARHSRVVSAALEGARARRRVDGTRDDECRMRRRGGRKNVRTMERPRESVSPTKVSFDFALSLARSRAFRIPSVSFFDIISPSLIPGPPRGRMSLERQDARGKRRRPI